MRNEILMKFDIIELFLFEQHDHRREREQREYMMKKRKLEEEECACACVCACLCPRQNWSGQEESQCSLTRQGNSMASNGADTM